MDSPYGRKYVPFAPMGLSPSHLKRAATHSSAIAFSGVSVRRPRSASPARNSRSARIFGIVVTRLAGAPPGADWAKSRTGNTIPTRARVQRIELFAREAGEETLRARPVLVNAGRQARAGMVTHGHAMAARPSGSHLRACSDLP